MLLPHLAFAASGIIISDAIGFGTGVGRLERVEGGSLDLDLNVIALGEEAAEKARGDLGGDHVVGYT